MENGKDEKSKSEQTNKQLCSLIRLDGDNQTLINVCVRAFFHLFSSLFAYLFLCFDFHLSFSPFLF